MEPVHVPPLQLKVQAAPSSHVALGHTDPGPPHSSVQLEPAAQRTFQPPQSPPFEQWKKHCEPSGQVTSPEHCEPLGLQSKLQVWPAPHATFTPRQLPLFEQL